MGITTSTMASQSFMDPSCKPKMIETIPPSQDQAEKKNNEQAMENNDANCFKHFLSDNGAPAQVLLKQLLKIPNHPSFF